MDAIDRIRDFAQTPASTAPTFQPRQRRPQVPSAPAEDEPSVHEMCRLVRPYGFVVRVDATARIARRPALKLLRFTNRSRPAGTFAHFADLMAWLMRQAPGDA